MILYHFTAQAFLERIQAQGLTRGMVPWSIDRKTGDVICRRNLQWLTTNKEWSQEWMKRGSVPFSRNSVRISIFIPRYAENFVIDWKPLCERYALESAGDLNEGADYENWRLFAGAIPPDWIVAIDRNPSEVVRPDIPEIAL